MHVYGEEAPEVPDKRVTLHSQPKLHSDLYVCLKRRVKWDMQKEAFQFN